MAATDFAIFNQANTLEFVLPPPDGATWEQPVVGESFSRVPIYDVYKNVTWAWAGPIRTEDYLLFLTHRNPTTGLITFRTKNALGQFVKCQGKTDAFPGATRRGDQWWGIAVSFWRVTEVS